MQVRGLLSSLALLFAAALWGGGCGVTAQAEQSGKAQFTQAAAPRRRAAAPASTFTPNYAHGPHMDGLFQWRRFPLRVFFDMGDAYTPQRERAARAGFDQWARATNGVLDYQVVGDARRADVIVRFLSDAYVPGEPGTVGSTMVSIRNKREVVRARMALAVGRIAYEDLPGLAAHEWGHALGIQGHSDDPDDLMYRSTTRFVRPDGTYVPGQRVQTVTERDRNTIKAAYKNRFRASSG
jgi:hypothetical protein